MVTFLCGRGGCTVMTASQYKPVTLPKLPRRKCAYLYLRLIQRYGSKEAMYITSTPCSSKPLKNGWCATHQYVQAFLEQGATIGYPRLQVNEGLWIGAGIAQWEAYAEHYAGRRIQEVLQAIARWKEREL